MERRKPTRTGDRKKPGSGSGSKGRSAGPGARGGSGKPPVRGAGAKKRSEGGSYGKKEDSGSTWKKKYPAGERSSRPTGDSAYGRKPERGRAAWGDKPARGDSSERPTFREKREGDRPVRGDGSERPAFREKRDGDKPEFRRSESRTSERPARPGTDSGDRKPGWREKKEGGFSAERKTDRKPTGWVEKPAGDREKPSRSYGDRDTRSDSGDRGTERKSSGWRDKPADSPAPRSGGWRDKKEGTSSDENKTERKSSGWGEKPSRGRPTGGGFRDKRDSGPPRVNTGERGSTRGSKPEASGSERPYRSREKTGDAPFRKKTGYGDKPSTRSTSSDKPYAKKSGEGDSAAPKWNRKEKHEFYGDAKRKRSSYSRKQTPNEPTADDGLMRLNKFIANAGICSRREADEMIKAGVIKVNGEVVTTLGHKLKPEDEVKYNDSILRGEKNVYLLLNKPKDFITTTDDPEDRKTVMNLIDGACKERVYPVGRLDRNTTGVLLFTNDGDLARKLTHPSFEIQKVYQVEVEPPLSSGDMDKIAKGVYLDDGFIQVDEIAYSGSDNSRSLIGVEVHSGKNRIVRRIFEHFGYKVKKLDRVIFAGLTKKDMPRGRWRMLSELEIANLKMLSGKKRAASTVS